jgi:DNA-directed RNA polymerase specialized sigma24 family protein
MRSTAVADQFFHGAADHTPELDEALITDDRDPHLWGCVGQLPERDQRLLQALIACDRPSYAAVAAAMGMPVGSIGPTRMRALLRLRHLLAESDYAFRDAATP